MKHRRPFLLWLLCLVFLGVAFIYLLQIVQTIQSWNVLLAVQYRPGPWYPLFQGVLFLLAFLCSAGLLWLRINWAPTFAALTTAFTFVWYWLDRLVLTHVPQPIAKFLFALVLFLILFILMIASLWAIQPFMRSESPEDKEATNEPQSA